MKIHCNLAVLRGEPALIEVLAADRRLAPLVVARIAPDAIAVRQSDADTLVERLEARGLVPREVRP